MKIKKILSSLLAATMLFGSVSANAVTVETDDMPKASGAAVETFPSRDAATVNSGPDALAIKNGVIFHAWSWSFNTITQHLDEIAAAGYTAIQTSPPSECYSVYNSNRLMGVNSDGTDGAWWWHYQPTKLAIGNYQLGTRNEYIQMCSAAEERGIKIIADIVANHTTSHYTRDEDGNEITAGQIDVDPEFIEAVGGYDQLYHEHGFDEVKNPTRTQSINYMDGGLPDINTENPRYQAYLIEYMNDLIACGCDGFRFDTAKIIGVDKQDGSSYDFWNAVTGQKTINNYQKTSESPVHNVTLGDTDYDGTVDVNASDLFYYGEIVNDRTYDSKYRNYIAVTDDTYSYWVREAVRNGSIPTSCTSSNGALNSQSVVWVESHDNYCGDSKYTANMLTEDNIKLNWAIITARNVGTPLFFNRPEGSDALNGNYWGTNIIGNKGNDQFKDPEIVAVNKFRTAMLGTNEYLYNLNSNKIMQIDRYSSSLNTYGSCIVNVGDAYTIKNAPTQLLTGTYIDAVTGNEFEVTSNGLSGSVPASSVTVLYKKNVYYDVILNAVTSTDTFTDSLTVTPTLKNGSSDDGTYQVVADDRVVESGSFTNGVDFTIGNDVSLNGITQKDVSLILSATNSGGKTVSRTYYYTKTSSNAAVEAADDTSTISNKTFIYFFDTMKGNKSSNNFYVTLSGTSGSHDGKMEYSDDLHCYFYAYDGTAGYTKARFTDNDKIKTAFTTINPGKLFALTGYSSGTWIELSKIKKHTVYYCNTNANWDNGGNRKPSAYIWNNIGGNLGEWPGVEMTSIGSLGSYSNVYSMNYYYPEISSKNKNFSNVIFNNKGSNQTYDMTLPSDYSNPNIYYTEKTGYSKERTGSSGTKYYWTFESNPVSMSGSKSVSVVFKYYDSQITSSTPTERNVTVTQSVTEADPESVIAGAFEQLNTSKPSNLYDQYYCYTSQLAYTSTLASTPALGRSSNNELYGAKLNPKYLTRATYSLSGLYGDSIRTLSASGAKWVTYKDGAASVDEANVKHDLSNVTQIEVYLLPLPKEYDFTLHYPTISGDLVSICSKDLYISENNYIQSVKAKYNQLADSSKEYAEDMAFDSSVYAFDGWYILEHPEETEATSQNTTGYLKVSSNKNYNYRHTADNIELYAVFRPISNDPVIGCTVTAGDVEVVADTSNSETTVKYRYNSILNTFGISSDSNQEITGAAVIYVNLGTDKEYSISKIQESLNVGASTTVNINNETSANCSCYCYYKSDGTLQLTNKNRAQFVLTLNESQISGNTWGDVLAFTAIQYGGEWIISDNCVRYQQGVPSVVMAN